MGYIEKNLMPGEELLLRPRYHWIRFLSGGALLILSIALTAGSFAVPDTTSRPLLIASGALALAGLLAIGWRALVDSFDEFGLSSARVFKKTGFLSRNVRQIPLDKVQDVNIRATLWGRWLSYGDVELQTAGTDGTVVFPRIQDPEKLRNALFAHLGHPGALQPAAAVAPSVEARLRELTRLKDAGLVTAAEYEEKRRALIQEI
jgi:uncharacterized membrane protein YdbT with pleckstrin-like domain